MSGAGTGVRYVSTRAGDGAVPGASDTSGTVDFREALLRGLAPDGGLYVPTGFPHLPAEWRTARSPAELGGTLLRAWLGDALPEGELDAILADAFDFPVPLVSLGGNDFVLELFHGPTLAFKDFGARFQARALDALLARTGGRLTVLVATSGDTGSAVAAGFAGRERVDVVLLYPRGRVSPMQERQLTVARPGVSSFAVEGNFDDCQRLVKAALGDPELAGRGLTSANSINVGRFLPQQVYYLWALLSLERDHGVSAAPRVIVPSGNLGNLTAGLYATLLPGGPAGVRFVAAHNANDYFPRWLARAAEAFDYPATVATASNAMDVGAPSNFERLEHLARSGVPLRELVTGAGVSDAATLQRIAATHGERGYLPCPHTAVGLEALARLRAAGADGPALVLATAHPAKFPEVLERALPGSAPVAASLEELRDMPVKVSGLPPDPAALREVLLKA